MPLPANFCNRFPTDPVVVCINLIDHDHGCLWPALDNFDQQVGDSLDQCRFLLRCDRFLFTCDLDVDVRHNILSLSRVLFSSPFLIDVAERSPS